MGLSPCIACGRHIRETDACPFCSAKQPVKSVLAAVVLAAGCGGGAKPTTQPVGAPPADAAVGGDPQPAADAAADKPPIDPGDTIRPLYGVDRN